MDRPVVAPKVTRRTKIAAALGAAALLVLAILLPTLMRWARADRAVDGSALRYGTVRRGDLQRDVSVQGRVVAALRPTLFSSANGVVSVRTQEGSVVRKGDVLAVVESEELRSALAQSRSTLASTESELGRQRITGRQNELRNQQAVELLAVRLEAARRSLARAEKLHQEGLAGASELERAQDELRITTLQYDQALREAGMQREGGSFEARDRELQRQRQASATRELQRRVDELIIRAPFDGLVANVAVSDRDAVIPGQPILSVVNLSSLELEIAIPEDYAAAASIGTPAVISFAGREYRGKMTAISPQVTGNQVAGRVAFEGAPPASLKQNQRITTRLVFESRQNVLKVPRGAFLESGGGRFAYVVDGEMATKRAIEVGAVSVNEVEIVSGLREGEKIVLSDTTPFDGVDTVMLR